MSKTASRADREHFRQVARLLGYLAPYRAKFFMALTAMLISSLLGLAFPYVTGRLIDTAVAGDSGSGRGPLDTIALFLAGVLALQAFFSYFQSVWFVEVGERILALYLIALTED